MTDWPRLETGLEDNMDETVKVVRGHWSEEVPMSREQSDAEKMRATILDTAEEKLREGRDLIVEGLKMFGVVGEPQHRNLPTVIGQQIEQVIEFRRLKS